MGGVASPQRLALRDQYVLHGPAGSNRVIVAGATVDGLKDVVWDLLQQAGWAANLGRWWISRTRSLGGSRPMSEHSESVHFWRKDANEPKT